MRDIIQVLFDSRYNCSAVWRFPHENLTVSVAELRDRVTAYARVLKNNGVSKGDRVGFIVDNGSDLVCLLYATWYLNAVAVPLRPRSGRYLDYQTHLDKCDRVCRFKRIVYGEPSVADELSNWVGADKPALISVAGIVAAAESDQMAPDDDNEHDDDLVAIVIDPDDIAIIQFSSGSTGDPKGVVVTHRMMIAQLQNIEDNHARSRGEKVASSASWLPINHDMGLFIGVLSPVFSGCDNLLATPSYYMKNPPRWFGLLAQYRVDFSFSTNSVLASSLNTLRRLQQSDNDLSELHLYIAAEKVSPIIVRRSWDTLARFGCPIENIHIGYGMAENALGATYTTAGPIKMYWFKLQDDRLLLSNSSEPDAFELVSVGIANDEHTISVRDRNDNILPELRLGEFSIESPCISPAYYNDPQNTELKLKDGRFRTGDLGFYYDGEFYFYARSDDMIIAGGRNIVPDDIEISAETLNFIKPSGSVLLAVDDQKLGTMQLYLLAEGDARWSAEDVKARSIELRQHILDAHDLLIKTIYFCEKGSIEKTSSGKKRRKVIRQRLLNNELTLLPLPNSQSVQSRSVQYGYQTAV